MTYFLIIFFLFLIYLVVRTQWAFNIRIKHDHDCYECRVRWHKWAFDESNNNKFKINHEDYYINRIKIMEEFCSNTDQYNSFYSVDDIIKKFWIWDKTKFIINKKNYDTIFLDVPFRS